MGVGETFEATTLLYQALQKRISYDITRANRERNRIQLLPFPPITLTWTMLLQLREVRLLRRRGFLVLDDFLFSLALPCRLGLLISRNVTFVPIDILKHPEVVKEDFAPYRPVFLPPERTFSFFYIALSIFFLVSPFSNRQF